MSVQAVRAALETALAAITPSIPYAWQNVTYTPPASGPYARVSLLLADPANDEISPATSFTERGIFQVLLAYPLGAGPKPAEDQAELIRAAFYRGRSLPAGASTVTIERTPTIAPPMTEDGRWLVPVTIRWSSPASA